MSAAEEPDSDDLGASLKKLRPEGPAKRSLEKRLAIAAILASTSQEPKRTELGRLVIQRRLGGGGMGIVYRAFDPGLGRLVAVKLLRGSVEREARALIATEARALAKLSHPNVVTVHEIVDTDDELYFVMEHVQGVTLRAWLDTHPRARWPEVLEWFVQAGRGLVAAHEKGIVHRDFKPENVLVGDDGRVRVADFGLAHHAITATEDAVAAGTPHYMAPELRAGRPATEASDQYSFCLALCDALRDRDAPEPVTDVVALGLVEDPDARHPSMSELVTALESARQGVQLRSRTLLIERVHRLWLRGVLERSLGDAGGVDVALTSAPELVDPPWDDWGARHDGPPARATSRAIAEILRASHDTLLIVGPPGAGKTTLMLRLCRELHRISAVDVATPAPVVLSLSTYHPSAKQPSDRGKDLARFLVDELVAKYGLPRPSVLRWLENGETAIMLDGLDETAPNLRADVVAAINAFRAEHPVPIVVACRDSEYEAIGARLAFGGAVRVEPLDDESVYQLLEAHGAPGLESRVAVDDDLREKLRNPLLLTLYAGAGDARPSRLPGIAPSSIRPAAHATTGVHAKAATGGARSKSASSNAGASSEAGATTRASEEAPPWRIAYERYVNRAFEGTPPEERRALESQLCYLARAMRRLSISDLWLEHLSFDWFDARWERNVGYALGVLGVLAFGLGVNLATTIVKHPFYSALTFGVGVSVGSFAYTRGRIKPIERLRWSPTRALRLLPITMICATIVGLAEALHSNFWSNIVGAALTGAALTVAFALEGSDRETRVRPNEGIRRSLAYALGVSLGIGVPVGLLFGLVFEPFILIPIREFQDHDGNPLVVVGTAVGVFVTTALFLIYGGFTVLMHGTVRLWLAARTPLPFDLQRRVLDRAVALGLMRQVGGGYVFLHRTLLDHFADQDAAPPTG